MKEQTRIELENYIEEILTGADARGAALGVVNADGKVLYQRFFGWRDAERQLPIDADTIFGIASVTKSFTALAIMQLQEAGILSLEDPIAKYVPEYRDPVGRPPVRIWHLLCHSGGFFPLPRLVVDKTTQKMGISDSLQEELVYRKDFAEQGIRLVAERLAAQTEFTGAPGQQFSYCNDGFGVLSDIVRRYSGYDSFAEYVEQKILQPLGMTRSNLGFLRNSLDENAAILYSKESGLWRADRNYENDAFVLHGGGAMKSTLADLMRYVSMYLRGGVSEDGTRILSRAGIREMMLPRQQVKPGVTYGYGLQRSQMGVRTLVGHGGSLPGVSSQILLCPEAGIAVVFLCNTMDVPAAAAAESCMRAWCGEPVRYKAPVLPECAWSEEQRQKLVGTYASGEGDHFTIIEEKQELFVQTEGGKRQLHAVGDWKGLVQGTYGEIWLQPVRTDAGDVRAAQYGTRTFPKESETDNDMDRAAKLHF